MTQSTNDSEFTISSEFIESRKPQFTRKKGGPYSKNEKIKRQNEVYRLHFEYGYSARKISEMMQINRNTITSDIDKWHNKIIVNFRNIVPEDSVLFNIQRFNVQRSRLRESLDKAENFQQKLAIERMIFDIDSKIINSEIKMIDSVKRVYDLAINRINKWLKDHKIDERYMTFFDTVAVSSKSKEKISKIIKEDRDSIRD